MTDTTTEKNPSAADDETSEMRFGAGETAWLAVVTVLALLGVALGVIALIVAKDNTGGAAAPAGGGAAVTEQTVDASEFAFDPSDLNLAAGQEVTVELDNTGAVEHNFTVLKAGEEITSEDQFSEDLVLAAVDNTAAGASNTTTLTLEPGTYQAICTIPGHFAAGMQATITAG